jgi:thioredoxin reductase (NADPH)
MSELDVSPRPETPDVSGAYPRLSDEQIMVLSRYGVKRHIDKGEALFREGDPYCDFFVILSGSVAVVQETEEEPRLIAVHGPKRFLGDLSLLTGQRLYLTAVAEQPTEVLAIPIDNLKEAATEDPGLGDCVLRAFIVRRSLHSGIGAGFRIVGSRFSEDARRLRDFASRNRLPYRWIDLEDDQAAEATLKRLNITPDQTPVVIWKGHHVLYNPSNAELASLIGLRRPTQGAWDLLVVGAGPAGLAAAVYGASEGLTTVVIDSVATGGQAATSSQIENYLGFPAGISGAELADRAVIQAKKFGAMFTIPAEAKSLSTAPGYHVVRLADDAEVMAHAVILATGASDRRLEVPGAKRLEGTSVYYAATDTEANLCRGDPVVIVGGGNSAGQASVFLAKHAAVVNLVIRHENLERDMSRYLADRIEHTPGIRVWRNCEVLELLGETLLREVVIDDRSTGARKGIAAAALFVLIGTVPHTQWLEGQLPLDERGFVLTGRRRATQDTHGPDKPDCPDTGRASMFETARPGVFAVGDVRSGSVKRVATAVGEGAVAVQLVHEFMAGIPAEQP